jgi:hypothetical protein
VVEDPLQGIRGDSATQLTGKIGEQVRVRQVQDP